MGLVIITGANRGIGLGLVRHYVAVGRSVLGLCRLPEQAYALREFADRGEGRLRVGAIDIASDASVGAAAVGVSEPVDLLINNAGIIAGQDQSLQGINTAEWLHAFNVNTLGAFRVTRAFLPHLRSARGKVLLVTSQLGASTWPLGGYYAYASSKAALNRVTRALAIDLRAEGISVACVHPGHVKTDMASPGAQLTPAESAAGIYAVAERLDLRTSGRFFTWAGEEHAW